MKKSVSLLIGLFLLTSTPVVFGEQMTDLVKRNDLFYPKFSDVPFTGTITGKSQGKIKNGKRDGPWVRYYINGQLWVKKTYKDGKLDGPWSMYWTTGRVMDKGTYKDGNKEGLWVGYHENGQLFMEGTYKNGKKEGPWVTYHEDGQLLSKGTYKNGQLVEQ